jgi:hypothetical protein
MTAVTRRRIVGTFYAARRRRPARSRKISSTRVLGSGTAAFATVSEPLLTRSRYVEVCAPVTIIILRVNRSKTPEPLGASGHFNGIVAVIVVTDVTSNKRPSIECRSVYSGRDCYQFIREPARGSYWSAR